MDLAAISIKRPIFITCVVTLILLIGYIALRMLPVDLFPDVTFPTVVVNTPYPGAGPAEVETLVSKVLEENISGVSGIDKIRSTSKEGISTVIVEFTMKTDIKHAEQQIRDRVAFARSKLPDDIEESTIRTVDPADQPIAIVSLSADLSPAELFDLADQTVKPKLEQIDQVGLVEILGGRKREIQVQLDNRALRAYEIPAQAVSRGIEAAGKNVPAGKISRGQSEMIYRTVAEFRDLDIIRNSIVRFTGNEHALIVDDVGEVVDTLVDEKTRTFVDGKQSLLLMVFRQSGANTIQVVDRVTKEIGKLNKRFEGKPGAATTQLVKDGAARIRANVYDVNESILIGIALTIVVVYLFLGSLRSTIITGLALPNSLLGAFILMLAAGFTINIMSLLALSLAVGLLIDDAIVVRENIFRHMEMGKSPEQAALDGTREVSMAVIATTAAILAVFGPIGFLQGTVGQFFKEFGLTICFAMAISLFDALTIAPMLSAYFAGSLHPKPPKTMVGRWNMRMLKGFDRFQTKLEHGYEWLLHWVLKAPLLVLAINIGLFIGSIMLLKFVPKTFLPPQDNGEFMVSVDLPPGTSLDAMATLAQKVDMKVRANKEVKRTVLTVGNRDGEPNYADVNVEMVPAKERKVNTSQFKDVVREQMKEFAKANPQVKDADISGGGQRQFNLNIVGENLPELEKVSQDLKARLKDHPALTDVDISYRPGKPEFQVIVKPELAQEAGISTAVVGGELRTLVEGETPAVYRQKDREYDVRVRLREDQRDIKSRIGEVLVPNLNQSMVALNLIAETKQTTGPSSILREDRSRYVQVSADIRPGGPGIGGAMTDIRRILSEEIKLPEGVSYTFVGQAERFQELMLNMVIAMGLGILFIFFVLSSLYESFITPFAIMLVLPLAAMGAFFGLFITRTSLDMFSMIGCVMLMGLATKNSILMIDYTVQLMKEGVSRSDAVVKAGVTRLRPILMTSLALIGGMLPVAIGLNEASKQRTSLGIAVIGGTISSTLLTLVVVPAAFSYIDRFGNWLTTIFNRYLRGKKDSSTLADTPMDLAPAGALGDAHTHLES